MNSQCLPFRQVPHSTRLFLDYLDVTPSVQPFYPRSPRFLEWAKDETARVRYPDERRAQMADILERQNKSFGAAGKTFEHITAFRDGAFALVTGQQVGLFGGPVFSIYKALSAVKLAQEAQKLGINCVPVFWLATEDHDLEEVNQAGIANAEGHLERVSAAIQGKPDAPVGMVRFGAEISDAVNRVAGLLGDTEALAALRHSYTQGESFGTSFAKLFANLFRDFGVILLDGSDPELDRIAQPIYCSAISRNAELHRALLQRDKDLQAANYHQQVRVADSSTLLFLIENDSRLPLHSEGSDQFLVGEVKVSEKDLLRLCETKPEMFSPNVLLRPVVQDFLLPTLTYVGGSAEVAYFAQAGVVYEPLLGRVTPIVPRFSATLIEAKPQALLDKYGLSCQEVLQHSTELKEKIGAHLLPPDMQASFDNATAAVQRSMAEIEDALAQLDKTLVESAKNAQSKMLYQITNLHSRAARAELRQAEIVGRHAEVLTTFLYPNRTLQEREFAGIYFLARHGGNLLHDLLSTVHPYCMDHQLITL